jgi:hypothetical protein
MKTPTDIPEPHLQKIDLADPAAVRMWTEKFGCTEHELADAIRKVGPFAQPVRAELARKVLLPKHTDPCSPDP